MNTITAIYENGLLRPLTPLAPPEHTCVQIQVQAASTDEDATAHRRRVHEAPVAVGLSLPTLPAMSKAKLLSAERREELARILAAGGPSSNDLIEECEDRQWPTVFC